MITQYRVSFLCDPLCIFFLWSSLSGVSLSKSLADYTPGWQTIQNGRHGRARDLVLVFFSRNYGIWKKCRAWLGIINGEIMFSEWNAAIIADNKLNLFHSRAQTGYLWTDADAIVSPPLFLAQHTTFMIVSSISFRIEQITHKPCIGSRQEASLQITCENKNITLWHFMILFSTT